MLSDGYVRLMRPKLVAVKLNVVALVEGSVKMLSRPGMYVM